jgi:hypothetical protein
MTKSGADISMQSQILNLSNTVLATSATKTFTSAAYIDPNGFKIGLGNDGGYGTTQRRSTTSSLPQCQSRPAPRCWVASRPSCCSAVVARFDRLIG